MRLRERPAPKLPVRQRTQVQRILRKLSRFIMASYRLPKLQGGSHDLPVRFRPVFMALTLLSQVSYRPFITTLIFGSMILLALLGFHPTLSSSTHVNDKVQHFFGLGISTALFYWVIDVEDFSRRVFLYRWLPEILTVLVCGIGGDIISECVQSLLPYKTFQSMDVVANLLGSACGLIVSRELAKRRRHRNELAELYQPLNEFGLAETDEEDDLEQGPEMKHVDGIAQAKSRRKRGPQDVWRDDSSSIFSLGDEEPEDEDDEVLDAGKSRPTIAISRPSSESND